MKKFHAFYWNRRFIAVFTRASHLHICSVRSIQSTRPNQCRLVKIYFNITLPSTPRSSKPSHPFRFPYQNPVRISLIKYRCYIPRPLYSPWFDHPNNTGCVKKPDGFWIWKAACQLSTASILTVIMYNDVWSLVDMEHWSVQQRIAALELFIKTKYVTDTQRGFRQRFERRDAPSRNTLLLWVSK